MATPRTLAQPLSFDALDNAHVTIDGVPKCAEGLLIARTTVRVDGLRDAVKLEQDDALIKPTFIDACRQPACQEAAACRLKSRAGELRIRSERLLVTNRAVCGNPICFSHLRIPCVNVARPRHPHACDGRALLQRLLHLMPYTSAELPFKMHLREQQ